MTSFIDGPAAGQALMLKGQPRYMRVTKDNTDHWDALDQSSDTPRPNEQIFAYELHRHVGMSHVYRGKNGSGFYPISEYKFVKNQPAEATMRNKDQWLIWVALAINASASAK